MKKLFVVAMVIILVMGSFAANAELSFRTYCVESRILGVRANGETVWDSRYFVRAQSEFGDEGDYVILEVSQEEYELLDEAEREAVEEPEVAVSRPWYGRLASFATFWNPND